MKRKSPNPAQIRQWLKKQGHDPKKADKVTDKKSLLELHGVKP